MLEDKPPYQSFILRLWGVRENDRWVYRASLQPIPDGVRRGFVDLPALFAFLQMLEVQTRPPDKLN